MTITSIRTEYTETPTHGLTRADVISARELAALRQIGSSERCSGCGLMFSWESDRAEHFILQPDREWDLLAGDCPRDLLAIDGLRTGQSFVMRWRGHLQRLFVHGLNRDGTPRIWGNGAQHQADCPCCTECRAPIGKHSKDCSMKEDQ